MSRRVTVEIWFDLICPWCLIGKRHLASALGALKAAEPELEVDLAWRHFLLLPQIAPEGEPYQAFYERRLGGAAAVAARREQVREAGRAAGLAFAFEAIRTMPNTIAAHDLIDFAERTSGPAAAEALIERLFRAYFLEGKDIGDQGVLAELAEAAGLDPDAWFADGSKSNLLARLSRWAQAAASARVSGVPYLVFGGRTALSGAQPPEVLLQALLNARTAK